VPQAAQLDADDLRREPAVGDRWQGCTQSAQLAVLARQGLVPHRAQLEVALRGAQACILGLQPPRPSKLSLIQRQAAGGEFTASWMG